MYAILKNQAKPHVNKELLENAPKQGLNLKHKELICEKPTDPLGAPVS
jgi:hypothetical protein